MRLSYEKERNREKTTKRQGKGFEQSMNKREDLSQAGNNAKRRTNSQTNTRQRKQERKSILQDITKMKKGESMYVSSHTKPIRCLVIVFCFSQAVPSMSLSNSFFFDSSWPQSDVTWERENRGQQRMAHTGESPMQLACYS